jgi:hypothetical protein
MPDETAVPDAGTIVHKFEKSSADKVLGYLMPFNGEWYADIRVWYEADAKALRLTNKGLRAHVDLLTKLEALIRASREAVDAIPGRNGVRRRAAP